MSDLYSIVGDEDKQDDDSAHQPLACLPWAMIAGYLLRLSRETGPIKDDPSQTSELDT